MTENNQLNLDQSHPAYQPTIIVNQPRNQSNGLGVAGFILSLLAIFLGWIPVFG